MWGDIRRHPGADLSLFEKPSNGPRRQSSAAGVEKESAAVLEPVLVGELGACRLQIVSKRPKRLAPDRHVALF